MAGTDAQKHLIGDFPDIMGMAYLMPKGSIEIAYLPKCTATFNVDIKLQGELVTANAIDPCDSLRPITFAQKDALGDVHEFTAKPDYDHPFPMGSAAADVTAKKDSLDLLTGHSNGKDIWVVRVPRAFPVHSNHEICTGKITSKVVQDSVRNFHPPLALWLKVAGTSS